MGLSSQLSDGEGEQSCEREIAERINVCSFPEKNKILNNGIFQFRKVYMLIVHRYEIRYN